MTARLFACLILPLITPTLAVAQAIPDTPKAAKPAKEKKICRGDVNSSSRIAPKICKTQSQWDAQADTDQANQAAQRSIQQSRPM